VATRSRAAWRSPGLRRRPNGGNGFFQHLFGHEWELTTSPGGAHQWVAKGAAATVPDAHDRTKKHQPTMLTTDLSLRFDPSYERISRRFMDNPDQFEDTFARAWFKLTPPRHGAARALSRTGSSSGRSHLAGPNSCSKSQIDRCGGYRGAEGQNSGRRVCPSRSWFQPHGRRRPLPWLRQTRRRERRSYSSGAAKELGRQSAGPTDQGAQDRWKTSGPRSILRNPTARKSR